MSHLTIYWGIGCWCWIRGAGGGTLAQLRTKVRDVIHCTPGIGRTGTLATTVLIAAGMDLSTSLTLVGQAGNRAAARIASRNFLLIFSGLCHQNGKCGIFDGIRPILSQRSL